MCWTKFTETTTNSFCLRNVSELDEPYFHFHRPRASCWDEGSRHLGLDELYLRQSEHEERRRNMDPDLHPRHLRTVHPPYLHSLLHSQLRYRHRLHRPQQLLWLQRASWRNLPGHPGQGQGKRTYRDEECLAYYNKRSFHSKSKPPRQQPTNKHPE